MYLYCKLRSVDIYVENSYYRGLRYFVGKLETGFESVDRYEWKIFALKEYDISSVN